MEDPLPKREGGRAARRASVTHDRLLHAALSVFNSQGFDGCAIEDITEEADVGKGTFYRHFRDKYAVLSALIQSGVAELEKHIAETRLSAPDLQNTIKTVVQAHLALFREQRGLFLLLLQAQGMLASRRESLPDIHHAMSRYWEVLDKHLSVERSPSAPADSLRTRSVLIAGMVMGIAMTGIDTMPPEKVAEQLQLASVAIEAGMAQHLRCAV